MTEIHQERAAHGCIDLHPLNSSDDDWSSMQVSLPQCDSCMMTATRESELQSNTAQLIPVVANRSPLPPLWLFDPCFFGCDFTAGPLLPAGWLASFPLRMLQLVCLHDAVFAGSPRHRMILAAQQRPSSTHLVHSRTCTSTQNSGREMYLTFIFSCASVLTTEANQSSGETYVATKFPNMAGRS